MRSRPSSPERQTGPMRFGREAPVAALVALALSACGSGTSVSKPGSGRHEETFDDGALYDVSAQKWVAVPKAPFAEPLWSRGAVWDGRDFVVLGTPCAQAHTNDENPDGIQCGHTQPVAAAFDPTTKRWQPVAVPPLHDMTPSGYVLFPDPLGAADGRSTFLLTPPDIATPTQIVAVAPGAEPRRITPPPEAKQHCTLGGHLFAFGTGDESVVPTPAGRVDRPTLGATAPGCGSKGVGWGRPRARPMVRWVGGPSAHLPRSGTSDLPAPMVFGLGVRRSRSRAARCRASWRHRRLRLSTATSSAGRRCVPSR